jgi:hypothetical protein
MPANYSIGLNDVQRRTPPTPDSRQQNPETSIGVRKARPRMRLLVYSKLLAQGQVFERKISASKKRRSQRGN